MIGNMNLFDESPMEIGGFRFNAKGVDPVGQPTIQGWQEALIFAEACEDASPYWVGDLLAYAESRAEWREKLSQAMSVTKRAKHTLQNRTTVTRKVSRRVRELAPTISHAAVVTGLEPEDQEALLTQARDEEWTVSELTRAKRQRMRPVVIQGQAPLEGMYRVLYADPPWKYSDSKVPERGALGKAERHYPTMTIKELCKLPVAAHALPDAVLFLWVTSPMLPEAFPVLEAWGFTYKTGIVWDKVLGNWGHYVRVHHEHLLIATRGSCMPDVPTPMPDSVQVIRRGDVHSEKPEEFRRLIEKLYTFGPYLELFGRKRAEGWDVFGNDARLWAVEAAAS